MGKRGDRAASRFLLVSLWVSATLIVGVVAWSAVNRLGREGDASTQTSLSQAEVSDQLAKATATTPTGPSTPSTSTSRPPPETPGQSPREGTRRFASWTISGGRVGASCQGSVIRLMPSYPADGWVMEVKDRGPDRVEVEFSNGDRDSKLRAECLKGIPTAQSDGG